MAKLIETTIKGIKRNWYGKVLSCKAENKGLTIATYGYFTNAESAKDIQNAVELRNISFTAIPDKDIFKQAYEVLSHLEEFKDAEDC